MTAPCAGKKVREDIPQGLKVRVQGLADSMVKVAHNHIKDQIMRGEIKRGLSDGFTEVLEGTRQALDGILGDVVLALKDIKYYTKAHVEGLQKSDAEQRAMKVFLRKNRSTVERFNETYKEAMKGKDEDAINLAAKAVNAILEGQNLDYGADPRDILPKDLVVAVEEIGDMYYELGEMLVERGLLPRETFDRFSRRYQRHIWTKGQLWDEARRAIEEELGAGRKPSWLFGSLSNATDADIDRFSIKSGDKVLKFVTDGSSEYSPVGFRSGTTISKAFSKPRHIPVVYDIAEVPKHKAKLLEDAAKLDELADAYSKAAQALEGKEADAEKAKADDHRAAALELKEAASKVLHIDQAIRAGLMMDPVHLAKVTSELQGRAVSAAAVMQSAVKNLGGIFIDVDAARAAGHDELATKSNIPGTEPLVRRLGFYSPENPTGQLEVIKDPEDAGKWLVKVVDHSSYINAGKILEDGERKPWKFTSERQARDYANKARVYIWRGVSDHLNELVQPKSGIGKMYDMWVRGFSELKTVLNLASHPRQILGNAILATLDHRYSLINPIFGQKNIFKLAYGAARDLKKAHRDPKADPELTALVHRAIDIGAVQEDTMFHLSDIDMALEPPDDKASLAEKAGHLRDRILEAKFAPNVVKAIKAHRAGENVDLDKASINDVRRALRHMWLMEDQSYRFGIWRDLLERRNPDTGDLYTDAEALAEVDRILPNPDKTPIATRKMTRHTPFLRFALELNRIMSGHVGRAAYGIRPGSDLWDKNNLTSARDLTSTSGFRDVYPLGKFLGTLAALSVAGEGMLALHGYDEEERKIIMEGSHGLRVYLPGNASIDISGAMPWADFMHGFSDPEDRFDSALTGVGGNLFESFVQRPAAAVALSNPVANILISMATGKPAKPSDFRSDEFQGKIDSKIDKTANILAYLAEMHLPSTATYGTKKFMEMAGGAKNVVGENKTSAFELMSYLVGVPGETISLREKKAYRYFRRRDMMREIYSQLSARRRDDGTDFESDDLREKAELI